MKPFEKALIQAILEEYGDIYSTDKQTCNLKFQKMNGSTDVVEENNNYPSNTGLSEFSLWINVDAKGIYLSPVSGTTQFVFMNQTSRTTCMQLLMKRGFVVHNA